MDETTAKALREPFPAELVGKLPRIWCGACREARGKVCAQHQKARCEGCGNNISAAHMHLGYVGHADTTDRLLQVDPSWTWEPLGFDQRGLPALDDNGGLWIRLTVAGVTRLGFGHADGKRGGDAMKETIGDAIRNAALRFGVALDLWRKEPPPAGEDSTTRPARQARTRRTSTPDASTVDDEVPITAGQRTAIQTGFSELGYGGNDRRDERLQVAAKLAGLDELGSVNDLTRSQARRVLDGIATRRAQAEGAPA